MVKEHARWKDARQMSSHTSPPFFFFLCSFFVLCSFLSFLLTSLIFSLSLWGLEASQAASSWNWVWNHPGIYQLLLNLLSGCQIPHRSCAYSHSYAHIHTPPGRVKQPLFWQKIDIKKEEQKIPFWLEVEGFVINFPLCDGKMVNTCQSCLLRVQNLPSVFLEDFFVTVMIPPHPVARGRYPN